MKGIRIKLSTRLSNPVVTLRQNIMIILCGEIPPNVSTIGWD
jgi:hypothetical protein